MNNFTAETRRQLKREQKARVMENLGRCIGIQLMYLVPYVLLMVILYVSVFGRAFALIAGGVSANDYQLMAALSRGLNTVWLCIALMLAITGPLQFGLMHFYIGLAHGEDVTVGMLMYPFTSLRSVWAGIRMVFTLWLRGIIWSIVPTVIYSTIVFAAAMAVSDTAQYQVIAGALQVVYLLVMIPIRVKLQTYNAGWLLLAQDENRSAWAATREASWAFRGNLKSDEAVCVRSQLYRLVCTDRRCSVGMYPARYGRPDCDEHRHGDCGIRGGSGGGAMPDRCAERFSFGVYGKLVRACV